MLMNQMKTDQFRFLVVGSLAAGLYFLLLVTFLNLNLGGAYAAIISYGIAVMFGYTGQRIFTFRSQSKLATTAPRYAILQFLCAISAASSAAVTERIGFTEPLVIAAVTTAVLGVISYYASSKWVFRE